jgi:threonine dehydrogenase-like Zn-dependent dehydrogenase
VRSLTYVEPGRIEWREADDPRLRGPAEALIVPVAASRCAFDRDVARGRSPFGGPFAIGHEGVGRVVDIGDAVTSVKVGDVAVVVSNISCGGCERCRRGLTAHCLETPPGASYGLPGGGQWGGLFDDVVRVPFADAMLTPVPPGIDPLDVAPAGDSLGIAQAIMAEHLKSGAGRVAVFGAGEHGLYQVAFAVGLGAESVLYVDDDAERRDCAAGLGARTTPGPPDRNDGPFDLIVDAAGNEAWLRRATHMLEPEGSIECLGGYFGDLRLPGFQLYGGGVKIRFGINNSGPHVKPTIDAVTAGVVTPSRLYAQLVEWDDLPDAYIEQPRKLLAARVYDDSVNAPSRASH